MPPHPSQFYGECGSGVHGERPFRLSEFKSHPSLTELSSNLVAILSRDECRNDYIFVYESNDIIPNLVVPFII